MKFYLDADKIAAARDKICSSLDKIVRDNRLNFAKFSRLADWIPALPCYLIRAVFVTSAKSCLILERKLSRLPFLLLGVLAWTMHG